MSVADRLRRLAAQRPGHLALKWPGGSLTYAALQDRSSRVACALRAGGVGIGDRVAFLDRNGPEHLVVQFAAAKLGAIFTPLSFRLAAAELAAILGDCEPAVWVVGGEYASLAERALGEAGPSPRLVVIGEGRPYDEWLGEQPAEDPGWSAEPSDVTLLLYSSGTTGRPKGIELTAANLDAALARYEPTLGLGPDAVSVVVMPMFHVGGGGWALAANAVGATNVIVRDFDAERLVDVLAAERVTHAALVPVMVAALLEVPGLGERDFGALQTIAYGAAPMSEALLTRAVRTFSCGFFQGYGLTETTSTVVQLAAADHDPGGPLAHRLRSVGRPICGAELRIVDPATLRDLPAGEAGEILIKGPTVMRGYWRAPEATAAALLDGGWLRSGDAGHLDEDGYLYLRDRVKDMIVSGGENIYPAEIENALASHPAVAEVAVIGVPSERWGETPKAFVVRASAGRGGEAGGAEGVDVTEAELIEHCRTRLARFKCPSSVEFVDALPRNAAGKVLKRALRAQN